jgi:hypothetical protein
VDGEEGVDELNGLGSAEMSVDTPATTPTATMVGINIGVSTMPSAAPAKTQMPPTAAPPVVFTTVRTATCPALLPGAIQLLALPTACMLPPNTPDAATVGAPNGMEQTAQAPAATADLAVHGASAGSLDWAYAFRRPPAAARPTCPTGDVNAVPPEGLW